MSFSKAAGKDDERLQVASQAKRLPEIQMKLSHRTVSLKSTTHGANYGDGESRWRRTEVTSVDAAKGKGKAIGQHNLTK